jgi:hypothetical protein
MNPELRMALAGFLAGALLLLILRQATPRLTPSLAASRASPRRISALSALATTSVLRALALTILFVLCRQASPSFGQVTFVRSRDSEPWERRPLPGLAGEAEGIRNDGHRNFRPVEKHGRHVLSVLGRPRCTRPGPIILSRRKSLRFRADFLMELRGEREFVLQAIDIRPRTGRRIRHRRAFRAKFPVFSL